MDSPTQLEPSEPGRPTNQQTAGGTTAKFRAGTKSGFPQLKMGNCEIVICLFRFSLFEMWIYPEEQTANITKMHYSMGSV